MTDKPKINQQGQGVQGPQTNITGKASAPVLSGQFHGPIMFGGTTSSLVPHQIPPPPEDFTGRDDEMNNLQMQFESGAIIVGLHGMGGIGKTALAYNLAEKLRDSYPDGQLMVELQGTSEKPLTSAEAMTQAIRSFHPIDRLPENEAEIRGLYRTILDGKRILLLLDNAADDRQVRPLLPPKTCGVIITSRRKFTLPGLKKIDLGKMKPEKAVELLLKVCGFTRSSVDLQQEKVWNEIAKLCGYLPLALRAAGSLLANTPDLSPEQYANELQNERTRLERIGAEGVDLDVQTSFNLSYERLSPGTARVFREMSIFPADFNAKAEEVVCQDEGHKHLSDLVRWNLVEFLPSEADGKDRYTLHDLVRIFVTKLHYQEDNETVRAAAQKRHAEHYRIVLSRATALYFQGGRSVLDALGLFDLEWANIKAGQAWAEKRIKLDNDAAALCSVYSDWPSLLELRIHPQQRIRWLEASLTAARHLGDRKMESVHLGNLGSAYYHIGEFQLAIKFHEQAFEIDKEIGDRWAEGSNLGNLGNAFQAIGNIPKSIELFEKALEIFQETKDLLGEENTLVNMASAYGANGDAKRAIKFSNRALVIAREIGDRHGEGIALGILGCAYSDLGKRDLSIKYHEKALEIDIEIGDLRGQGIDLDNLGLAYAELGDPNKAIGFYRNALVIDRKIGNKQSEGNTLWNLSLALYETGEHVQAIECATNALRIRKEIGDPRTEKVRQKLAEWQGME